MSFISSGLFILFLFLYLLVWHREMVLEPTKESLLVGWSVVLSLIGWLVGLLVGWQPAKCVLYLLTDHRLAPGICLKLLAQRQLLGLDHFGGKCKSWVTFDSQSSEVRMGSPLWYHR